MPKLLAAVAFLGVLTVSASSLLANQIPIADAGPDQDIYVGEYTGLQGSATDPDGHFISDWLWTVEDFPEGGSWYMSEYDAPDPLFRAEEAGDYLLSLIAFDGLDWSDPDTMTIHASDILPPVAVAEADVTGGIYPLTVHFDGSGSYSPQGGELDYGWDFGDGSDFSSEISPVHTFEWPGIYSVSLTVVDSGDRRDRDVLTITVDVPEPATLILLAAGGLALLKRKRSS